MKFLKVTTGFAPYRQNVTLNVEGVNYVCETSDSDGNKYYYLYLKTGSYYELDKDVYNQLVNRLLDLR